MEHDARVGVHRPAQHGRIGDIAHLRMGARIAVRVGGDDVQQVDARDRLGRAVQRQHALRQQLARQPLAQKPAPPVMSIFMAMCLVADSGIHGAPDQAPRFR